MAAPYQDTTALANIVQPAYDKILRIAFEAQTQFRNIVDVRPEDVTSNSSTYTLNIYPTLAKATTPLNESTDPSGVTQGNTTPITITLNPYGNFEVRTDNLAAFTFASNLRDVSLEKMAFNMVDTVDTIIETVMAAGTQVLRYNSGAILTNSGSTGAVTTADLLTGESIRQAVARLRASNTPTFDGMHFVGLAHPYVLKDLRSNTSGAEWRALQVNNAATGGLGLINGEIGIYEGVRWIETPRCSFAATGTGSINVYQTYIVGKEALAEAVAPDYDFQLVLDGVVVDPLKRKWVYGWKGTAGWALFRTASLWRIETTSSLG